MRPIFTSVDRLQSTLDFHRDRHAVLSSNLANVDTPGFRPMDIRGRAASEAEGTLAVSHAAHLGSEGLDPTRESFTDDAGAEPSPDGNTVELERELAKLDANRVRYVAVSELASRRLAMLRYAAGDGG